MLNKEIPFLRIGLPLCAGIVCGYFYTPGNLFFIATGTLAISGMVISLAFNRQLVNHVYGLSFMFALFSAGLLLYTREKAAISDLGREESYYAGYLSDYPEEKEKTYKLILRMESGLSNGETVPLNGSILLYHKKDNQVRKYLPGDRLIIKCSPVEIEDRGNPNEFSYRFYMETRGIKYYAFTDSTDILQHSLPQRRRLIHNSLIIREKIIDMFRQRGIEGERLALIAAITLGQKNMLDAEQKQYFIKAGVMHIMAVSGLHAVILSLFIFKLLFFLRGRFNIVRILITLIILWLFSFVTGLTPSVLRATIMFTFLQAGNIMKRPVNPVNSVLASAFILILFRPSVIFDAGFLLSYSAVIYIICFYRDFYLKLHFRHRLPDLIWQSAAVSVIAQAGTLPLTIMLFNRFPTWFLLSNIIIVPLSSLVIIIGCLVPLTFPLVFISQPLAHVLDFLTGLTEYLTALTASLPFSSIDNIGLTLPECIVLTITIFLTLRYLLNRKSFNVIWPLILLLLLVTTGTIKDILLRRSNEVIVYNSVSARVVGIRNGKILNTYSDTIMPVPEVTRHAATLGLRVKQNIITSAPCIIRTAGKKIMITNTIDFNLLVKNKPDIIVLSGSKPVIRKIVQPVERLDGLIITSATRLSWQSAMLLKSMNADTVHFTGTDGSFRIGL